MIQALTVYNQLKALLDAEGSSYFDVNLDYIPAINRAKNNLVQIINSILGAKDFAEQHYRELIKNQIWQTSIYSRVDLTLPNRVVWDILSVTANPVLNVPFVPIVVPNNLSAPLPGVWYVSGGNPCDRLNAKEWVDNAQNPFKGGYNAEPTGNNLKYGYLHYVDYFNGVFPSVQNELEIRPYIPQKPVSVVYVMYPTDITALTDNLTFPITFLDILVKASLKEIAIKSGDGTTYNSVSQQDIVNYIQSMANRSI